LAANTATMDDQGTSHTEVYQRWDDGFVFREMRLHEGQQVNEMVGAARPISCELNILLEMLEEGSHVDGFYVGELDGEVVASLVVTQISDDVKYIGLLSVAERLRGSGIGRTIMDAGHKVTLPSWNGIFCFSTGASMESIFERQSYRTTAKLTAYQGIVSNSVYNLNTAGADVKLVTGLYIG